MPLALPVPPLPLPVPPPPVPPPVAGPVPWGLAACCGVVLNVADMAAHYVASGMAQGSSRRVAVVSSDFRVRGLYRRLGVRNPRSAGVASLRQVVPAATLGRTVTLICWW